MTKSQTTFTLDVSRYERALEACRLRQHALAKEIAKLRGVAEGRQGEADDYSARLRDVRLQLAAYENGTQEMGEVQYMELSNRRAYLETAHKQRVALASAAWRELSEAESAASREADKACAIAIGQFDKDVYLYREALLVGFLGGPK